MKKTLQEKFVLGLTSMGFVVVESRTSKYVVMKGKLKRKTDGQDVVRFMLLGRVGAVRINVKAAQTGSVPVSDTFKSMILSKYTGE